MMRCRAGLHTDKARRHLRKESQHIAPFQFAANDHLAISINAMHLKIDFAISRPIVLTACMIGSSESWGPQQHPLSWHSRAGGGAVHSINSGHWHAIRSSRRRALASTEAR